MIWCSILRAYWIISIKMQSVHALCPAVTLQESRLPEMRKDGWRKMFMAMKDWRQIRCRPIEEWHTNGGHPHIGIVCGRGRMCTRVDVGKAPRYCVKWKKSRYTTMCTAWFLLRKRKTIDMTHTRKCLKTMGRRLRNWKEWYLWERNCEDGGRITFHFGYA